MNTCETYRMFLQRQLKLIEVGSVKIAVVVNQDWAYAFGTNVDYLGNKQPYKDEQDFLTYGIFTKVNV